MRNTMQRAVAIAVVFAAACGRADADTPAARAGSASGAVANLHVGRRVPAYSAVSLGGTPVQVGTPGDSLTLVNVWATWCTSCREEMQDVQALHRIYRPKGLRVIAVSVDAGSDTLVRRFVQREKLTFTVVHDQEARLQSAYHVSGVPSTYLVGSDGTLLWQHTGGIHGATDNVRAAVESAIAQAGAAR